MVAFATGCLAVVWLGVAGAAGHPAVVLSDSYMTLWVNTEQQSKVLES